MSDPLAFKYCLRDYLFELRERAAAKRPADSEFDKGMDWGIQTELNALENKLHAFQIDADALVRLELEPFLNWADDEPGA